MTIHLDCVTPLLLTYNEEPNIARTLDCLPWAARVVVVDSGSNDHTLQILERYTNVEVHFRPFDSHARQWNAGLDLISSGWVLSLDADYLVTDELCQQIQAAIHSSQYLSPVGYRIPFRYCVAGRPLRGTVLPARISLFRREFGSYVDDGHTQDLVLEGVCGELAQPILHDDRKPLSRWLWAQNRYLSLEVAKLLEAKPNELSFADRIRKQHIIAPFAVMVLCLVWHRGLLDGWRGWYYAFQRMYVEILLSLMLWEGRR